MSQTPNQIKTIIQEWTKKQISLIHTAIPGTVVTYSPSTNRASVQPSGAFKTNDGRSLAYPVIHNTPVIFPMGMGGTAGVTFPITAGDGCLIVFSESQTDDMLSGGDSDDPRKHSLNDAICIPGLYSGAAPSNVANPNDVCISNGSSKMKMGASGFSGTMGDGTSFSFSGGDLVVNGISLTKHTHPGCQGGSTGTPK